MTSTELGFVALRIVALVVALDAADATMSGIAFLSSIPDGQGWLVTGVSQLAGSILVLAISVWAAVKTKPLAARLFPRSSVGPEGMDSHAVHAVALSLLGAWLIATALPGLIGRSADVFWQMQQPEYLQERWLDGDEVLLTVELAARAAVGVVLFVGAGRISAIWQRMARAT